MSVMCYYSSRNILDVMQYQLKIFILGYSCSYVCDVYSFTRNSCIKPLFNDTEQSNSLYNRLEEYTFLLTLLHRYVKVAYYMGDKEY